MMNAADPSAAPCRKGHRHLAVMRAFGRSVRRATCTALPAAVLLAMLSALPAEARSPAPASAAGPPEAGVWLDHTRRGAVMMEPCGANLCGRVHWLKDPLDKQGKPLIDDLNPDKSKRRQPVCGLQVIGGLVRQADGSWDNGWIYDPEKGERYDLAVRLDRAGTLTITGYMGVKWLSETHRWTRVARALPACSATSPATKAQSGSR
jgi:uncharacterized protein (DUF2147 family)